MKFLHRLDALERQAMIVETNVRHLRVASFLDGRERFWSNQSVGDVAALLENSVAGTAQSVGWIFHVGFCGSTLLTRLLEANDDILCLREPQSLVDLSDQLDTMRRVGKPELAMQWLGRISGHFANLPGSQGHVVVKPSSWVNPLLPAFEQAQLLDHAVFVTMDRRAWLSAVVRGGRDRLAFVARCADHAVRASGRHAEMMAQAVASVSDPIDQVVRVAALLNALQNDEFDRIDPKHERRIDYGRIVDDPRGAVSDVRAMLGLPGAGGAVPSVDWHAKDPAKRFDSVARGAEDLAVEAEHGCRIDQAMAWIDRILPRDKRTGTSALAVHALKRG